MELQVTSVRYIKDHLLEVEFVNGEEGTADFSGYAKRGGVFKNFADLEYFKRVSIDPEWGVLCWPGDVDIAPETVYRMVTGKEFDRELSIKEP